LARGTTAQPLALSTFVAFNLRPVILAVSPVLPLIRTDLHLSFAAAGSLTSLPILCLGLASVPGALLSNLLGPRRLIGVATAGIGVGAILRILQPAIVAIYAGTVILAVCIAVAQPAAAAVIRGWFPDRTQQAAVIYTAGLNSGGLIATVATVYLLGFGGWRGTFVIWAVPALVASVLWFLFAPRMRLETAEPAHLGALLRNPGVWRAAGLFGAQSIVYFSATTWIPFLLRGGGPNSVALALLLMGVVVVGVTLVLIGVRRAFAISRGFYVVAGAMTLLGTVGFLVGPTRLGWLFGAVVGLGSGMTFAGAMALPPLLAKTAADVAGYSALMLAGGYLLAFLGPFLGGLLLDVTGLLTAPFLVLGLGGVAMIGLGLTFRSRA
jgi:MFS transporter, CP family, cyanate transporter